MIDYNFYLQSFIITMNDFDTFFSFQEGEAEMEHEAEEDWLEAAAAALAIILGGAGIAQEL